MQGVSGGVGLAAGAVSITHHSLNTEFMAHGNSEECFAPTSVHCRNLCQGVCGGLHKGAHEAQLHAMLLQEDVLCLRAPQQQKKTSQDSTITSGAVREDTRSSSAKQAITPAVQARLHK